MNQSPPISCSEYSDLRRGGSDVLLLDVRSDAEWKEGHLPEALHLPFDELSEQRIGALEPYRNHPILVCCARGEKRSPEAVALLRSLGYTDVRLLSGGMDGFCAYEKTSGHASSLQAAA